MFKRALLFLLMLSLLLGGMGMSGTTTGAIKVGLMGTFKGSLEREGIDMRDGALLALDQFQQNVKGQSFQLVVANDKGDSQEAIQKAQRLIGVEKVSAIVDPFHSSCALAPAVRTHSPVTSSPPLRFSLLLFTQVLIHPDR